MYTDNIQYGGATTTFFTIIVYIVVMIVSGYFTWNHFSSTGESKTKKILFSVGAIIAGFLIVYILNLFTFSF